ncbi:MAG TPA: pyridoxal phosphate-dependent aminotransferase [Casimicrobiaceae bacterium]|jgi:aspartate/methionine/tyrosine aminotransferase|nr:pyridoxal phosphate-dependent aminotransferase [Casimicrobiaceae bacterium]
MDPRNETAARVQDIAPFHVMEVQTAARALEATGRNVIHMEIGEPDFPTPAPVLEAAVAGIAGGAIYYTSALGLAELRAAIATYYNTHYGVRVAPERIVVTAGSSAALLLTLALLVDRDEQILLADPGYPCNRHFVRTLEGEAVGIPVGPESSYQLTAELIARHWTPRTRGTLIASPSNPTGTTVPGEEMGRIMQVVAARRGALIVDEIYLGLSYAGQPRTALGLSDDIFVISSFSKYFNMTGWRLGWLVTPERYVRDIEKLAQNLYISPSTPSQRAALACFAPATLAILEARRGEFQARRDFLVPALRDLGFAIPVTPTGGFFVYADCSRFAMDSERFALEALQATGVAFTPGIDFGRHRPEAHVRFAYTIARPLLEEGVRRLGRWLPTLRRA